MRLFFSWQSDIPEVKKFIRETLQSICNDLGTEYDEDSRGKDTADYILNNILLKIDGSNIVVGDFTPIGTNIDGEKIPNPNVCFEFGYAEARLTRKNLIMVFCKDYGTHDDQPFDLNKRAAPSFSLTNENSKKIFKARLHKAIKGLLDTQPQSNGVQLNKYEKSTLYHLYESKHGTIVRRGDSYSIGNFGRIYGYLCRAQPLQESGRFRHAITRLTREELLIEGEETEVPTVSSSFGYSRLQNDIKLSNYVLSELGEELAKTIKEVDTLPLIVVKNKH